MSNRLPSSLVQLLRQHATPEDHIEDVICEATPKSPWVVSMDRERTQKPHPYAVIRQKEISYFDTYQDAMSDAGGHFGTQPTGCYYELVDATIKDRELPFRPPITFRGQVGPILLLTVSKDLLLAPGQTNGLHAACKAALNKAVEMGQLPKDTDSFTFLVPEGVRLCRLVEHKQ